jgi:glycosyltransferase involved in cell wall biosynthesis
MEQANRPGANLRVLHLVGSVGRKSGGNGPATLGLVQAQRELGLDARIWCLNLDDGAAESAAACGLSDALTVWPASRPPALGFGLQLHRALLSSQNHGFQLIHQHSLWFALSHTTASFAYAYGRPTVVAPEGCLNPYALNISKPKKWLALTLYERRNLERAKCLYALSSAEAKSIRAFGLRNSVAVVPNGISGDWLSSKGDAARFRGKFNLNDGKRIMLFLGRLHPIKGLDLLLDASHELKRQLEGWAIVVAGNGDPEYTKSLMALTGDFGLQEVVRFTGPLYDQDKRDAFAAASVYVLPSRSDAAPVGVLEALGAGTPVIATRKSPWSDLVSFGCGWWVESNRHALRDALEDALRRNPEDLCAMGLKGRKLVEKKYTWRQIAEQTAQLYEYLTGGGAKPDFLAEYGASPEVNS